MNEARVYADGFERSFAEVKDLLEFLAERGRNAKWIRKPTNTLRLAPLEKEAQNLDAADASMEEILEDTEKNTQLVLKMRGESYPVHIVVFAAPSLATILFIVTLNTLKIHEIT